MIQTCTDKNPLPSSVVIPPKTVDITWLLQNIEDSVPIFSIDRSNNECHTPRRNPSIENALTHFSNFNTWANEVYPYFRNTVPQVPGLAMDFSQANADGIFVPVIPIFEEKDEVQTTMEVEALTEYVVFVSCN